MSDAPKGEEAAAPPAPARSKSRLVLIAGAVVVLAGAGGGGYWWWSHRAQADPKAAAKRVEEHHDPADAGVVSFEPFVANLADEGGSRFLRALLKLVVASPSGLPHRVGRCNMTVKPMRALAGTSGGGARFADTPL